MHGKFSSLSLWTWNEGERKTNPFYFHAGNIMATDTELSK